MSIKQILTAIFARIDVKHKWQKDFLLELFELIFSIQGRFTFENAARYSTYNECTFRRNFAKFFDWLSFNIAIMAMGGLNCFGLVIGAIDCSYLPKAGKKTYGLDKFFSSVAGRAKKGLEISLLCLIDVISGTAWTLDVCQTPAGLSSKEGQQDEYTRIDFYMEQILDLLPLLKQITYLVADGFYAKAKVFQIILSCQKHLITKLRPDANMMYLFDRSKNPKAHGNKKYDGKVDWKTLDLEKWIHIGTDHKYSYLEIYTQVLYSPHFKRKFKVVLLIDTRNKKYILLACTDLNLDARSIVLFYQSRFKIEFLFRDAKQFTGLTHCQARSQDVLDFHFNMSLAAVNLIQLHMKLNPNNKSMNSFVRKAYNTKLVKWLFSQLSSKAEFDINHPKIQNVLEFGCLKRA